MAKMKSCYYKPDTIQFKGHWAAGFQWETQGSKHNVYITEFTANGLTCDCPGMRFHGKCKHTIQIAKKFIDS